MKKTILFFTLVIFSLLNFSCSSDDNSNDNEIDNPTENIYKVAISTNALEGYDSHILLTYFFEDGTEDYFFENTTSLNLILPENLSKINIMLTFGGNPGFNISLYKNDEIIEEINNSSDFYISHNYEF